MHLYDGATRSNCLACLAFETLNGYRFEGLISSASCVPSIHFVAVTSSTTFLPRYFIMLIGYDLKKNR